ncbi:MAG: response regulator [Anaerolineae bacterium]|nr:response regulator [Anaerolineae bacterium]
MNLGVQSGEAQEQSAAEGPSGSGRRALVLIVSGEPETAQLVRGILRSVGWETASTATGAEALQKVRLEEPDAIVAGFSLPDMPGTELCRALRERGGQGIPVILLGSSAGVAERVASLRAGAADYLVTPPDAQELVGRLQAALALREERAGYVIVTVGAKGGVGASVVAVNLAVALRLLSRKSVCVLDAAVADGTVDVLLNLQRTGSIDQLLSRLEELERADFEAILTRHSSGIEALWPDDEGLDPDELRRLILALRRLREVVVVDLSPAFGEHTASALEVADRVLVVLTPEIGAVRAARRFLQRARMLGVAPERLMLVLNRAKVRGGLQVRDIESTLGVRVDASIPDDVRLVTTSANRGVPFVQGHRRSRAARQIVALARRLAEAAQ